MLNVKSLFLVLLALGACAGGELQAAAKADPLEDLSFAALEKRVALNALRKEANPDRAQWPKSDVPGLDFTKATGNAIIVHHESGRHANPFATLTTTGAPFKLFHIEDDPYRLAPAARGIGLPKPEDKAKFRTDRYKPALEHIARAKYALFVVGKVEEPRVDVAVKSFTPGQLEGVALLYEIESKKLLGGFPIEARNSAKITTRTGGYTGQELDAVMHDFENNARAALWKGLKGRFPSAKLPTIVYLDSKE
jgi:hypothetical protein